MSANHSTLRFLENGMLQEICARIHSLKKERDSEVLYTMDGHRIPLDNLVSINGRSWA
jgi:hypothetical protein